MTLARKAREDVEKLITVSIRTEALPEHARIADEFERAADKAARARQEVLYKASYRKLARLRGEVMHWANRDEVSVDDKARLDEAKRELEKTITAYEEQESQTKLHAFSNSQGLAAKAAAEATDPATAPTPT
jgi:CCR4-NOT transcriptional regulation complex NOT5 subunit